MAEQAAAEVDLHAVPQYQPTHIQLALLLSYATVLTVWLFRLALFVSNGKIFTRCRQKHPSVNHTNHVTLDIQQQNSAAVENEPLLNSSNESHEHPVSLEEDPGTVLHRGDVTASKQNKHHPAREHKNNDVKVQGPPEVTFDKCIWSLVLFGSIMIYFYLCDYRKIFPQGERHYSRDSFLFLVFLFFLVALGFTIKPNTDKILNREQTEEWKGWMQVMFVWYHYFKAKEWYNWIRIYIACYVWMTGFGNFSFFWIRSDYSMWRMLKMLFRLNFLVAFVAMTTNNAYMLYYICAMHTYWFLSVYVFMRVLKSWNRDRNLMAVKFVAYAIFNALIFEIPGASQLVFRPFQFVLGLEDNTGDIMHEWSFRAGLDHWACFFGMLCAYNYPHFEALMLYLETKSINRNEYFKKLCIRLLMGIVCLALGITWYFLFMQKDKFEYNATHPYTSLLAIFVYIILRNIHPVLRSYHLHMFAWLGKITLETYLSQLHIYLLSNARTLLVFLDGYPLLNFSLATITYLAVSHTLFNITNDCSNYFLPKDDTRLMINITCVVSVFVLSYLAAFAWFL